jgi:hypothetical protein
VTDNEKMIELAHGRVKAAADEVERLIAKNPLTQLAKACDALLNAIAAEAVARASSKGTGV